MRKLTIEIDSENDEQIDNLFEWIIGYAIDVAGEEYDISSDSIYTSVDDSTPTSIK